MDLLDLYHAHEYSLSITDDDHSNPKLIDDPPTPQPKAKVRKPKFVPWEPYKAAPGHDRKGEQPVEVPLLIPYSNNDENTKNEDKNKEEAKLVDGRKNRKEVVEVTEGEEKALKLKKEIDALTNELETERKLNRELKNMFLSSLSDDLQSQVEALAGDKIHLARRLEDYCNRLAMGSEQVDQLLIERDLWKCKYMAQSIRSDELSNRVHSLVEMLRKGQQWIRDLQPSTVVPEDALQFATVDLQSFISRSPCDPKLIRRGPNFSNLTISCCKTCSGREIKLL